MTLEKSPKWRLRKRPYLSLLTSCPWSCTPSWATRAALGLATINSVPKQLEFLDPLSSVGLSKYTSKIKHPWGSWPKPSFPRKHKGPGFSSPFAYNDPLKTCCLCYIQNALLSYPLSQFSLIIDVQGIWGKNEDFQLSEKAAKIQKEKEACQYLWQRQDWNSELWVPTWLSLSCLLGEIFSLLWDSVSSSSGK